MRTQTIAGLFDGQECLAEPVDPTGWLAGPPPADGKDGANGSTGNGGSPLDQQDVTAVRDLEDRRADNGRSGRVKARSGRRSGRVRHLRRVRSEGLRAELARSDVLRADVLQADVLQVEPVGRISPAMLPGAVRSTAESGAEGYQMGRWARLALTMTVLAAVVVVVVTMTAGSAPRAMVDVTVAPGDTLWSIASQAAPDRDPRDVIADIRQLNDMPGDVLPIGVVLRVPADAG